jgi:NAD(P)-dependent dehydrogenase (short-subunit alcohol dehydrogenase family)
MSASPLPPLSGRVAVVTGATSGIGREVALGLARLGARTVVVGRGPGRPSQTAAEIARETQNPNVEGLEVSDLAVIAEARSLAATLLDRYPAIHFLVNSAGAYFRRRLVTADGLERTFALNVLAPYILTTALGPRLIASAPARVVNVASEAERSGRVNFDDLQFEDGYRGFRAYGTSKLELLWLTREFARRFIGTGVTVNAVHPGYVRSGFGLNNGGGTAFAMRILGALFARSVAKGAETVIWAAAATELAAESGKYYHDRAPLTGTPASQDLASARRLTEVCARLSGSAPP